MGSTRIFHQNKKNNTPRFPRSIALFMVQKMGLFELFFVCYFVLSFHLLPKNEKILTDFRSYVDVLYKTKKGYHKGILFRLVQKMGLEPTRHCCHWHLKPARLPFRHFCVCEHSYFYTANIQFRGGLYFHLKNYFSSDSTY